MRLIDLLDGDLSQVVHGATDQVMEIAGLTCDSRQVEPGYLFAALPGSAADGRAFISEALGRGAAAVLAPPGTRYASPEIPAPLLIDDNPRRRYALMAARFFPGQPEIVAAVTGTNGKTSVVSFLRQIWTRLGRSAASLGTLGVVAPGFATAGSLTTPDPVALHRTLGDLERRGVARLAMEASSHGLAQHRLDGIRVAAAAFTNLTRDHLDYHGSMAAYRESKLRLFSALLEPGGAAVLNADDECADDLAAACRARGHRIMTYGARGADVRLDGAEPLADGQRLELRVGGRPRAVTLPLLGGFQAANALCALALAIACGEDAAAVAAALETLEGAPGRVQRIGERPGGGAVFVDYAHTPDALANVLRALRPHAVGRLLVVFGCGGDRDPGKRPEMGRVAAELADAVIVTDDNPRGEDPAEIRRQVLDACPGGRDIGDRARAIATAIADMGSGDLLVVAGKGHETGQTVAGEVLPFNDADVARAALRELAP